MKQLGLDRQVDAFNSNDFVTTRTLGSRHLAAHVRRGVPAFHLALGVQRRVLSGQANLSLAQNLAGGIALELCRRGGRVSCLNRLDGGCGRDWSGSFAWFRRSLALGRARLALWVRSHQTLMARSCERWRMTLLTYPRTRRDRRRPRRRARGDGQCPDSL